MGKKRLLMSQVLQREEDSSVFVSYEKGGQAPKVERHAAPAVAVR